MAHPHPKCCLLVIDPQNEFLSTGGHFRIHNDSLPFLQKLPDLTNAFRASGYPIFWIRSEYANPGITDKTDTTDFLAGTHSGQTPCCEKGTPGAELHPDVRAIIEGSNNPGDGENIILIKTWFSAFKETALLAELKQREITNLFVCGVLTNVCVNATVTDARAHGFEVTLVEDCLGWRKRASHDRALRDMVKLGARLSSSEEICLNGVEYSALNSTAGNKLPELYYVNGSIPSWRVMMALHEKDIKFTRTRLLVMSDETRHPDFLALNHRGKAPVLVDLLPTLPAEKDTDTQNNPESATETIAINESLAILHYIEAHHNPDRRLLPPLTNRAAHARALARIQETENLRLIYDALEDAHWDAEHAGSKLDAAKRAQLIEAVDRELDYWEVYAEQTAFIASDEFGLADCALFPILATMVHRGFNWRRGTDADDDPFDAWPHLRVYYERVWERGGKEGPAQRSQPDGWERRGKANLWKGTKSGAKGLYNKSKKGAAEIGT